jgi:hypothetical protein
MSRLQVFLLPFLFCFSTTVTPQTRQQPYKNPNAIVDTFKKSIPCIATGKIGQADITITYHSPGIKNRVIWGGLVPYNEVWVTGAHNATTLSINKAFSAGGTLLPAGTYAIFTIPGKTEWILIINKNYQQHLADDYDTKDDLVRIKVTPIPLAQPLERLQYFIENGKIAICWENIRIEVPVTVQ